MFERVVLFVNYNFYESKRHFAKKFAEALERQGIEVLIIDALEQPLEAYEIIEYNPDFTCSFNSFNPLPNQKFLWDLLKIPHVSFLLDSAIYYLQYIQSPYSILTCVDRFDCSFLRSHDFEKTFFWPHAIERDIAESVGPRPYDVVFLGSCYDYESLRNFWKLNLSAGLCRVLDNAIEIVLSERIVSIAQALNSAWESSQLPMNDEEFASLFFYLDYYTRGKDRVELIRAIKDAPIHVFGDQMDDHPSYKAGWQHYIGSQPNVTLHPAVSFTEGLNVLRKSKICLNSIPCFRNGSHERVFSGLASGALPITSDSSYWRECFDIGSELLIYKSGHWTEVNGMVKELLTNESKRVEIVTKGRTKVLQEHTWDTRAEQLLTSLALFLPQRQ